MLIFMILWFTFGGNIGVNNMRAPNIMVWASKPDHKVDPLCGHFGPTAISKSCFVNFQE